MPTAHRLVSQLLSLGLLEKDESRRIQVGVRAWELASRSQRMVSLREAARPHLEGVQSVVNHHTQLGVLQGDHVLFVELLTNKNAVVNITKLASKLPIHSCSSGLVLLANSSPDFQDQILDSVLTPMTKDTIVDPKVLRRTLADVRHQDFAIQRGSIHAEAAGVAVPLRDSLGNVIAAISVIVPNSRRHTSFAVPVLLAASRGISRVLGAEKLDDRNRWISRI